MIKPTESTLVQQLEQELRQAAEYYEQEHVPRDLLASKLRGWANRLAALRQSPEAAPQGWRDISTAPKDANLNPVLLYWPYWTEEPVIGQREGEGGTWGTEKWLGEDAEDPGPTHWMPLPLPPATPAQET